MFCSSDKTCTKTGVYWCLNCIQGLYLQSLCHLIRIQWDTLNNMFTETESGLCCEKVFEEFLVMIVFPHNCVVIWIRPTSPRATLGIVNSIVIQKFLIINIFFC